MAVDAIPLLMWEQDPNWKFMKAPLTPRGTWAPTLYVDWSIFDNFWLFERAVQQSVRLCSRLTQFWSAERHVPTIMPCRRKCIDIFLRPDWLPPSHTLSEVRRRVLIGRHTPPEVYRPISAALIGWTHIAPSAHIWRMPVWRTYPDMFSYLYGWDAYRVSHSYLTSVSLTCLPWHGHTDERCVLCTGLKREPNQKPFILDCRNMLL